MGFFDKALKTAKNVGGSIASSAANVGSKCRFDSRNRGTG